MAEELFYIRKDDLTKLVTYYETHKPASAGDRPLRGFVLRKGKKEEKDALFPEPLYSFKEVPDGDGDVIDPNEDTGSGCPYPPGY